MSDDGLDSDRLHQTSDLNKSPLSQHHTLGNGPGEAMYGDMITWGLIVPVLPGHPGQIFINFNAAPVDIYCFSPYTQTWVLAS
jgi:hypothetical protein